MSHHAYAEGTVNIIIIIIEYHEIPTYYYKDQLGMRLDVVLWHECMHGKVYYDNLTNKDMTQSCDLIL